VAFALLWRIGRHILGEYGIYHAAFGGCFINMNALSNGAIGVERGIYAVAVWKRTHPESPTTLSAQHSLRHPSRFSQSLAQIRCFDRINYQLPMRN
jgi:hypothetical protein